MKLKRISPIPYVHQPDYVFRCPACGVDHDLWLSMKNARGQSWEFNGDLDLPTITPAIDIRKIFFGESYYRCHSFIYQGQIQFTINSTHALAGKTIAIPDYPTGQDPFSVLY